MNVQTTIPLAIWDAKKFKWKSYLKGEFESLSGCPNWLYEIVRQLKSSGQAQENTVHVISASKHLYAVQFTDDVIQIFSKKK